MRHLGAERLDPVRQPGRHRSRRRPRPAADHVLLGRLATPRRAHRRRFAVYIGSPGRRCRSPRAAHMIAAGEVALPTAEAVEPLPRFLEATDDAQIDALATGTPRHVAVPGGTTSETQIATQVIARTKEGRDLTRPVTDGHYGRKNGAGGNRTPVPEQSAGRVYTCSRSFDLGSVNRERRRFTSP